MGLIDIILRRRTVYALRKRYDKLREKADKVKNVESRIEFLRLLDQIEPSIVTLEEHHISHYEKKKTIQYLESNMRKIKFMMDELKKANKEDKSLKLQDNYNSR